MKKSILKLAGVALIVTISLINIASKIDVGLISDIGLSQIQMMAAASSEGSGGGSSCMSNVSCSKYYNSKTYPDGSFDCCAKFNSITTGHKAG